MERRPSTFSATQGRRALVAVREARRAANPVAVATAGCCLPTWGRISETTGATARAAGFERAAVAQAGHGLVTLPSCPPEGRRRPCRTPPPCSGRGAMPRGCGAHLAVEWAPLGVREACPVWDLPGAAGPLMQGPKARLDPQGVLNPGRFVGGI